MAVEIPDEHNSPISIDVYTEEWTDYGLKVYELDLDNLLNDLVHTSFIDELRARQIEIPNGSKHKITPILSGKNFLFRATQEVNDDAGTYGTELNFVFVHGKNGAIACVPEDQYEYKGTYREYIYPDVTLEHIGRAASAALISQARFN